MKYHNPLCIKTFLLGAMIMSAVLTMQSARAELIIYKGTAKVAYIGQNHNLQLSFKIFLIVDHDTANVGEIVYANANGQKFYSADTETNLHFVEVSGSGNKVYTAVSRPASDCDTNNGTTSESVFLEGLTVTLKINTNSSVYFPKTVTSIDRSYDPSNPASLVDGKLTGSFDQKNTLLSNAAGEDIDLALTRLVTSLQAQGYTEASKATGKNGGLAMHAARFAATVGLSP